MLTYSQQSGLIVDFLVSSGVLSLVISCFIVITMAWSQPVVEKLAREVQRKFPAKSKMSEASRDIQHANGMLIVLR
jgi:lipopolysaccharide export LptBFGC system permease protein LptF